MANSAHYLAEFKSQDKKAKENEKYAEKVLGYKNNLEDDCDDEIADINKKIDDLQEELKSAVRHNSVFTNNAANLDDEKEKGVNNGDSGLSGALSDLRQEHSDLVRKQHDAEDARDRAWTDYTNALKEEAKEVIEGLGF